MSASAGPVVPTTAYASVHPRTRKNPALSRFSELLSGAGYPLSTFIMPVVAEAVKSIGPGSRPGTFDLHSVTFLPTTPSLLGTVPRPERNPMAHLDLMKIRKRTYAAAGAFEFAARSGLDRRTRLLIELRASFLNGCTFCISMHSDEALKHDFGREWIDSIRDWTPDRQDTRFSPADELVLAFTTAGTRLSEAEFDVALQEQVIDEFGEKTTAAMISEIAAINMWNRLGVLSQK